MISTRRGVAFSTLFLGVGISGWICWAYNVFGPLGLASVVGGGALIVFFPAVLGTIVCCILLLMDESKQNVPYNSPTGSRLSREKRPRDEP